MHVWGPVFRGLAEALPLDTNTVVRDQRCLSWADHTYNLLSSSHLYHLYHVFHFSLFIGEEECKDPYKTI